MTIDFDRKNNNIADAPQGQKMKILRKIK